MPKISRGPLVATLIDRHQRSLNALHRRLQTERDPVRLTKLRSDIVDKVSRIHKLKAEQAHATS
jgi:hypothetical protein